MVKSMVFSSLVLLLLSGAAVADIVTVPSTSGIIFQYDDLGIVSGNALVLSGAGGVVSNMNDATIIQNQCTGKPCSSAHQDSMAIFLQSGAICGECGGTWEVLQGAIVGGAQMQLVGDGCGAKTQTQGLGIDLLQGVGKVDGTGMANANHTVAVVQHQTATNSAGTMNESNAVLAGQVSSISGGPATSATATSSLAVQANQVQAAL